MIQLDHALFNLCCVLEMSKFDQIHIPATQRKYRKEIDTSTILNPILFHNFQNNTETDTEIT